jgi:hypothetical protein
MDEIELSLVEYMNGLCSAPKDFSKCKDCGGVGMVPLMCCDGRDCGCANLPYDFKPCNCGATQPTEKQILKWHTGDVNV